VVFQTKPQIALDLIDRALANGVRVCAWTFDELYGRNSQFLDGLQARKQAYVAEIPSNTCLWTKKPQVVHPSSGSSQRKHIPNIPRPPKASQVRNLLKHSDKFHQQRWQRYRVKDTHQGPEVWEVKWLKVWRKRANKLPSTQQTLIVARNVRTGEVKYFLSNRVVGREGVTLRWLLRVAFGRWLIEACFRTAKEELGLDHFEVRGWRCIHRHYYLTGLSFLLCSRIRQSLDEELSVEQVRRSLNCYLQHHDLPPAVRDAAFDKELANQKYYQSRNEQARKSHTQTRIVFYQRLGIDVDHIKTCIP